MLNDSFEEPPIPKLLPERFIEAEEFSGIDPYGCLTKSKQFIVGVMYRPTAVFEHRVITAKTRAIPFTTAEEIDDVLCGVWKDKKIVLMEIVPLFESETGKPFLKIRFAEFTAA